LPGRFSNLFNRLTSHPLCHIIQSKVRATQTKRQPQIINGKTIFELWKFHLGADLGRRAGLKRSPLHQGISYSEH